MRNRKFRQRYDALRPAEPAASPHMIRTIGPNRGLLEGRRVSEGLASGRSPRPGEEREWWGADDLFANRPGVALSHQTTPSTRQWDGSDSSLIIGDITAAGERMTFRAGMIIVGNIARGEVTADRLIPDDQPAGIQSSMTISERGQLKAIKSRVSIIHTYIGDLQVELIAPSGKRAMLYDRAGAGTDDLKQTWDSASLPTLAALLGESIQSTWTLAI